MLLKALLKLTLDSRIDCSRSDLFKCDKCDDLFYSENNVETHVTRVHTYGEYLNLYPCEECGFQGGKIKEHQQNHTAFGTTKPNNTDKSYGNLLIYDGDIEADGDSDKDEDWTKSKEGEKLLREDYEDEFMFN